MTGTIKSLVIKLLAGGAALALPVIALAQSADAKYCHDLAQLYRKYRLNQNLPSAEVPAAIAKCEAGDTAAGIPVLEKYLRDQKISLPPRS